MSDISPLINEVSMKQIRKHVRRLEGVRHPEVSPDALNRAASYIWDQLISCGCQMSVHHFEENGQTYRNIIGTLFGTPQPEKKVIVLAHYDTVPNSPGADDNASGIAAMLEIARVLKDIDFTKSILFIGVNLEERQDFEDQNSPFLRGSKALASYAQEAKWEIEGVVDFECIAYAGENVPQSKPETLPLELPKIGNFIGVIGNETSRPMVQGFIQAIERYKIPLPYVPMVVPGNGEMLPDVRRSDHAAFWDEGYPAIMLTDTANFRSPHYHQPTDVWRTLNLSFATQVCRAATALVIDMAGYEAGL